MKIIIALLAALTTAHMFNNGVYDYSVTTIEGQTHTLQEYAGKKIMVIILPVTQTADDSAYLRKMDSVALTNSSRFTLIGIPSYEDGYTDSSLAALQPFYRSLLDTSVVISQGMYTHQSSDSLQSPLFNWLTHVSGNTHYEQEVGGIGQGYYINEAGELTSIIMPPARDSDTMLADILQ